MGISQVAVPVAGHKDLLPQLGFVFQYGDPGGRILFGSGNSSRHAGDAASDDSNMLHILSPFAGFIKSRYRPVPDTPMTSGFPAWRAAR